MNDFSFSDSALNVVPYFHDVKKMFYVEGKEDVEFWNILLDKFKYGCEVKVESVGGKPELKKRIKKLVSGDVDCLIGGDLDYLSFNEAYPVHDNLIYTYGHSIENTIYCPKVVCRSAIALGKLDRSAVNIKIIEQWLGLFYTSIEELVKYDIANDIFQKGHEVMPENCARFIDNKSNSICSKKLTNYIQKEKLSEKLNSNLSSVKLHDGKYLNDFVRGHFLFSGILIFLKKFISTIKGKSNQPISNDGLYAVALLAFQNEFSPSHSQYNYYQGCFNNLKI